MLKAIVIKAEKKMVKASDRDAWKVAHTRALAGIMAEQNITSPRKGGLSVYGTNVLMNITSSIGGLPTKNSTLTSFGENAEKISGEWVNANILVDNATCHACPGRLAQFAAAYWRMVDLCNDYGMDAIEIGHPISIYMEASERGFTGKDGTLAWGDTMGMVALAEKVALRQGLGNVMADGANATAKHFGHPELAMTVKGQGIPAYDPRGMKGMGIAYATSNRGACHLRAYTPAAELGVMPYGSLKVDPLEWKGKGKLTMIFQDIHAFSDSMDLCKFSAFAMGADEYAQQYAAVVGVPFTAADVLKTGERIYNLERLYNNEAGLAEGSDYLPKRFTTEASTMKGSEGHVCELDDMLVEYYAERGWSNGVATQAKLAELQVP
jgi:aldehyde:ferredoxin oxidoreductase